MRRAFAIAAIITATTAAKADVININVVGVVAPYTFNDPLGWSQTPLVDVTGVFGQAGRTLSGDAFRVAWTFNNTVLQAGVLTINGVSLTFGHGLADVLILEPTRINAGTTVNLTGPVAMNTYVTTLPTHVVFPSGPFTYELDPHTDNLTAPFGIGGGFRWNGFDGYFLPTTFEVLINGASGPALSVPGPIIGAGLPGILALIVGFTLWRRRNEKAPR